MSAADSLAAYVESLLFRRAFSNKLTLPKPSVILSVISLRSEPDFSLLFRGVNCVIMTIHL